ncbi:sugar kinase [Desertihabitans aurantiacus]|uniref:sugar kinase n=1 Tax=Desertihabitans aurantiacus TaxID=2282477 RepID=UPI0018E50FDE|nr:sugar kinase [Desertihabitans aurantiacus]
MSPDPGPAADVAPVLCLGETMVLGASAHRLPLEETPDVELHVAGAESNVAAGLAHLGQDVEWFSRLGEDPFATRIRALLRSRGVRADAVVTDPTRPTGLYFKDVRPTGSRVLYYRAGSAASALGPDDLGRLHLDRRRLVHVSGITAALSASCDALLEQLLTSPRPRPLVSFDVNHRPTLWDAPTAGPRLLELARRADVVLVGLDEAERLWGTAEEDAVRALLPEVSHLVVKDADRAATSFTLRDGGDERTSVPALRVAVVEAIGAGDAFAAGWLASWLDRHDPTTALRLGHLMAACTLQHLGDLPPLPPADRLRALAADADWDQIDATLLTRLPERP